ncbi:MAG: asparagine synthase C-terminal domain-containing protein [Candidatus Thorarchaeota archaeon]
MMVGIVCHIGKKGQSNFDLESAMKLIAHRGRQSNIYQLELAAGAKARLSQVELTINLGIVGEETDDAIFRDRQTILAMDSIGACSRSSILNLVRSMHQGTLLEPNDLTSSIQGIVLVKIDNTGVSIWRSRDGQKAIYIGKLGQEFIISTEKKCLWTQNVKEVGFVEPNSLLQVSEDGISTKKAPIAYNEMWNGTQEEAQRKLAEYLQSAIESTPGLTIGILFSGGVDSSLISHMLKDYKKNITLFSAAALGARDGLQAKKAAAVLGLKHRMIELSTELVWSLLPEVIFSSETWDAMNVEIALPFFVSSRAAKRDNVDVLVSGQGPDELFAGYSKHVKIFENEGSQALSQELRREISVTHEANISRDERVVAYNGISAYFPYFEPRFVNLALSIPAQWKISIDTRPERKVIFRKLATELGLPEELAFAPKKATQFSSGSSKILNAAILEHANMKENLTHRNVKMIKQSILSRIAKTIGYPVKVEPSNDLEFDLEPTYRFMESKRFSRQQ